jgi:hypothetical protein
VSIQENINNRLIFRFLNKLKLIKLYDYCSIIIQFFSRKSKFFFNYDKDNIKVFIPYFSYYTHPGILMRYYKKSRPLSWSTLKSSKVVHCIQQSSPKYFGKKIIIEPNDHCLVIGASLGIFEPFELVSRRKEISDYIVSSVSRVLIGNNELINHAKYYFSREALKKFFIYPEMACIPAVTKNFLEKKNQKLLSGHKIKYLTIASDFKKKAVELLLETFMDSQVSAELILVCQNVPSYLKRKILKFKNISLIENIPLSYKMKIELYKTSDVYINTTHIDGGGTVVNALEYGLPIITYTYHRGKGFIDNQNGILLSEPMKYYEPSGYGIKWNSMEGYLDQVRLLYKKGGYDKVQEELMNAIKFYEKEPLEILNQGIKSLEYAEKNSLAVSNQILRNLYKKVSLEE